MCILRALGKDQDASSLENRDLSRALAAAREVAESEHEEAAVLAAESERVLNASITAELLTPLLAERLSLAMQAPAPKPQVASARAEAAPTAIVVPEPKAATPPMSAPRPSAGVPSITDLIDGMLSQES